MRKFWGFYDSGKYRVGCNGATIYVYDENNMELAKFRDIPYAYEGMFKYNSNIFVAKSTAGSLAVYDLDKLRIMKKIKITSIGAQDEGYAFTPDGQFFYNIEKPVETTKTQLAIYRTSDFEREKVLFENEEIMALATLEFDEIDGAAYVLGFMRNTTGEFDYGFVGKLVDDKITEIRKLDRELYDYVSAYKSWQLKGYTEKCLEWHAIGDYEERPHVSLKQVYED